MSIHPVLLDDDKLLGECDVSRLRRGGPGGQHRNKVETAVLLRHEPSDVSAEANESRSQETNRRTALKRLRLKLAIERVRLGDDVAALEDVWKSQVRHRRVTASVSSKSGPAMVAFVFHLFEAYQDDLAAVVERLECTTSQLVKFLKTDAHVLTAVNERRARAGLHRLR